MPEGRAGLWGLEAAERFVCRWSGLTHIKGEIQGTREMSAPQPQARGGAGWAPGVVEAALQHEAPGGGYPTCGRLCERVAGSSR